MVIVFHCVLQCLLLYLALMNWMGCDYDRYAHVCFFWIYPCQMNGKHAVHEFRLLFPFDSLIRVASRFVSISSVIRCDSSSVAFCAIKSLIDMDSQRVAPKPHITQLGRNLYSGAQSGRNALSISWESPVLAHFIGTSLWFRSVPIWIGEFHSVFHSRDLYSIALLLSPHVFYYCIHHRVRILCNDDGSLSRSSEWLFPLHFRSQL